MVDPVTYGDGNCCIYINMLRYTGHISFSTRAMNRPYPKNLATGLVLIVSLLSLLSYCMLAAILPAALAATPSAAPGQPAARCGGAPRLAVTTPAGFCAAVLADGFSFPRGIQPLDDGTLLVVDMGSWESNRGSVWLLQPSAGGYQKKRLLDKLDRPNAIVQGPDGLMYVGAVKRVLRFDPHNPAATVTDVIGGRSGVAPLPGLGRHLLTSIRFDPHGDLYVNVGSASDHCESKSGVAPAAGQPCAETQGAAPLGVIRKYRMAWPAGTVQGWENYAQGLRNSMALAFQPGSGQLWQAENSRDAIQAAIPGMANDDDLPHDELNLIQPGAHYGWPYCYDNAVASPEYPSATCNRYRNPARLLPAHAAPLGMTFYTGSRFPARFNNSLIVGFHGYRAHGHRLVALLADSRGAPLGPSVDLISDWGSKGKQGMGAPVDVKQGPDGNLYLAEDRTGRIVRLQYQAP